MSNRCVRLPYSRTKINAARMSRDSSSYRTISAAVPTSAANPPVSAAAVDRRNRQTDGRTLDRFMTLTA